MAILKSKTGTFYDVDDNVLENKEVKREDLPKEMQQSGPGPGGAMPGLIQIIVHSPQGAPPPGGASGEGEGDVAGHHMHMHWNWMNMWRNCWRNCGW